MWDIRSVSRSGVYWAGAPSQWNESSPHITRFTTDFRLQEILGGFMERFGQG